MYLGDDADKKHDRILASDHGEQINSINQESDGDSTGKQDAFIGKGGNVNRSFLPEEERPPMLKHQDSADTKRSRSAIL